jgi:hypothetical protein
MSEGPVPSPADPAVTRGAVRRGADDTLAGTAKPRLIGMARRGISDERKRAAAIQGGQRSISQGERPMYRLLPRGDGTWTVPAMPGLILDSDARGVVDQTRAAIAVLLDVPPDSFDVERGR